MQRRHFEAIAEAVRVARAACPHPEAQMALARVTEELASVCRRANPQFDVSRFRDACMPDTTYRDKSRTSSKL